MLYIYICHESTIRLFFFGIKILSSFEKEEEKRELLYLVRTTNDLLKVLVYGVCVLNNCPFLIN
jgi:hypothetical protein